MDISLKESVLFLIKRIFYRNIYIKSILPRSIATIAVAISKIEITLVYGHSCVFVSCLNIV